MCAQQQLFRLFPRKGGAVADRAVASVFVHGADALIVFFRGGQGFDGGCGGVSLGCGKIVVGEDGV